MSDCVEDLRVCFAFIERVNAARRGDSPAVEHHQANAGNDTVVSFGPFFEIAPAETIAERHGRLDAAEDIVIVFGSLYIPFNRG